MNLRQFKVPIGAKSQVTLPPDFMEMLSLKAGGEVLLETDGSTATLTPMVNVLPEELRQEFEARRGSKPTDIPLAEFLADIGHKTSAQRNPAGRAAGSTARAPMKQIRDLRRTAKVDEKAQGA